MGSDTGDYSRNMYDESLRYVLKLTQEGVPWIDADENDTQQARYNLSRRIQQILGTGSADNGFKCTSLATDDFNVLGGGGTAETAGRFFLDGHQCLLYNDITYKNDGSTEDKRSIHPRITAISYGSGQTMITDSAANWDVNEHVGKLVTTNIQDGTTFNVVSNTQTQMVLTGDATSVASVGNHYRIELTSSVTPRTDGIFLNVYIDEYDCNDDPNLIHSLDEPTCAQLRGKLIQNIYVKEGSTSFPDYTDSDGKYHWTYMIAEIDRPSDTVDDDRPVWDGDYYTAWSYINLLLANQGKLKIDSGDTLNYGENKFVGGPGVTITKTGPSGDRTLTISAPENNVVAISGADTTPNYLENKISAGSNIIITKLNVGGNESLQIAVNSSAFVPSTRTVTAGTGLTGGGSLSSDITISGNFGSGSSQIMPGDRTVSAGTGLSGGGSIYSNPTISGNFGSGSSQIMPGDRTVSAGSGLSGGGSIYGNPTLNLISHNHTNVNDVGQKSVTSGYGVWYPMNDSVIPMFGTIPIPYYGTWIPKRSGIISASAIRAGGLPNEDIRLQGYVGVTGFGLTPPGSGSLVAEDATSGQIVFGASVSITFVVPNPKPSSGLYYWFMVTAEVWNGMSWGAATYGVHVQFRSYTLNTIDANYANYP